MWILAFHMWIVTFHFVPTIPDQLPWVRESVLSNRLERQMRILRAFNATEPTQVVLALRHERKRLAAASARAAQAEDTAAQVAVNAALLRTFEVGLRICQVPTAPKGQLASGRGAKPVLDMPEPPQNIP